MRIQQYSGPVMAKGLEDTAFYRYNRFVALNEVGGHPDSYGVSVSAFHRANAQRARRWPHAMLGTSTHDTKRGEDTRARLAILSEMPDEWARQVQTWSRIVRARRGDVEGTAPPDRNDEYLLYQLLIGSWPAELTGTGRPSDEALLAYGERIRGAMEKSMREGKLHSSWAAPDTAYEDAMLGFAQDALDPERSDAFLDAFLPFQARIAELGVRNSLVQTALKLTLPGMPDIYQGAELWDLSLVDPDNRRPVDFATRSALLAQIDADLERDAPNTMRALLANWHDGGIKLAVTAILLRFRAGHSDLFNNGTYEPLDAQGGQADRVVAFRRTHDSQNIIVVAGRFPSRDDAWDDTTIPTEDAEMTWTDLLTGRRVTTLSAATLLADLPVAVLVADVGPG
jgi:(1->4)-alpha-D-glucan 1-alpha-D-glucosylmutase